jgi:hypothetical protein
VACLCPRCRLRRGCPLILCVFSESETRRRGFAWTPTPRLPAGSGSGWTSATRSTSCTRWLARRPSSPCTPNRQTGAQACGARSMARMRSMWTCVSAARSSHAVF